MVGELLSAAGGIIAFLLFYYVWNYLGEWRRGRSAAHREPRLLSGSRVTIPIEYEDAGNRGLDDLPLGLNGRLRVDLAGGKLFPDARTPGLFGNPAAFWTQVLEDVDSGVVPQRERMGDVYVLARMPFPVGGQVALRFNRADWDAVCRARVAATGE